MFGPTTSPCLPRLQDARVLLIQMLQALPPFRQESRQTLDVVFRLGQILGQQSTANRIDLRPRRPPIDPARLPMARSIQTGAVRFPSTSS